MIQAYMEELMIKLATLLKNTMGYGVWQSYFLYKNRSPSRLEAHLVYKHTQKPDFLISNAR